MTPYEDADLAAVVLGRGLLDEASLRRAARLCAQAPPRTGALARALVESGALDRAAVDAALLELQRHLVRCDGCGARFCALPGVAPRRVACPGCARPRDVPAAVAIPPTTAPRRSEPRPRAAPPPPGSEAAPRGSGSEPGRAATAAMPGSERPGRTLPLPGWHVPAPGGGAAPPPGSERARAASGGLAPAKHDGLAPGERVGPYEVEHEISRGSMGIVVRARHVEVADRVVAIKVMAADLERDPDGVRRFQREGEVLASLDHPNVVRVFDAGRLPDGRPYLAMDYVEGTTLEHVARERGPIPAPEAARLLEPVARGVAYMNARGVVHRDLKLGNVLLDAAGTPRIADFGLAYVESARTRITQQGDLLGTPLYMAPEVVAGEAGVDGRIDVYSLGVMLFRLVTGNYPFYADNSADLFDLVLHAPLTYPPDLTPDARAVLERALARDRALRYQDAGALADDLQALAAGRPVSARPIGHGERLWRAVRSPGRLTLVVMAFVAGLLVAGGLWVVRRWPAWRAQRALQGLAEAMLQEREPLARGLPATSARELLQRADLALGLDAGTGDDAGAWRAAGEALALAVDRGDEEAARVGQALRDARAALARSLERRDLVEQVDALRGGGRADPAALQALLARARALQPAAGEPTSGAFERARGWLHLACGEAAEARAVLERAAAEGHPDLALAAWARLRAGDLDAADQADLPRQDRAELLLVRCALSFDAQALERVRGEVAALGAGPGQDLLQARVAWLADPSRREPLRALGHLAAARALSDRPADELPGRVQGHAALFEAEVLLALGWWSSAARALEVALERLDAETVPAVAVEVGGTMTLLAPRPAAALLRARCAALGLDGEAALAAAEAAVAWTGLEGGPALAEALALRAEARALAGGVAAAQEDLAAADRVAAGPVVERVVERVRLWRDGAARRWLPGADRDAAAAMLAAAEGTLRAAVPLDPAKAPALEAASVERCGHAARGFALAAALAEDERTLARAWAGLARARLFAGASDEAGLAAERAVRADLGARDGTRAQALVRAVRGTSGAVAALLLDLDACATDASVRLPQRAAEVLLAACEAAWALRSAPADVRAVIARAEAHLGELRAPPRLREQLLVAGMRLPTRTPEDRALVDELERRLQALKRAVDDDKVVARATRTGTDRNVVARSQAAEQATRTMLARYPTDPSWYEELYARGEEVHAAGFDCLINAFELRAARLLDRASMQRDVNADDPAVRDIAVRAMVMLLDAEEVDETLPVVRDDDLRRACLAVFAVDIGAPVEPVDRLAALRAAERFTRRFPHSATGWLVTGYLRLDLGDPGGALEALERAAALHPPFESRVRSADRARDDAGWAHLLIALAEGAMRRWDRAEQALRRAAEAGMWREDRLDDPRLSERRTVGIRPELAAFKDRFRSNRPKRVDER